MELVFDIGNTHTVIGLHLQDQHFKIWRTGTHSFESEDELFAQLYTLFQFSNITIQSIDMLVFKPEIMSLNLDIYKFKNHQDPQDHDEREINAQSQINYERDQKEGNSNH